MKKKIVFTGGGTAGHVMPNIALFEHFSSYEIHYIGSGGMEKNIIAKYPFVVFHEIECVKLIRSLSIKNLSIPFRLACSIKHATRLLKEIKPDFVFSKGGFVGLPVALACNKLKIPLFLHESDSSLGLSNRIAKKYANLLFTSFDSIKDKNVIYTGSPIRKEIYQGNCANAKKILNANDNKKPFVLFVGGSSGAKSLNDFVFSNIDALTKDYNVIHLTGKNEMRKLSHQDYYALPFCDKIHDLYALSTFVVSRGGSNALSELIALKKLCVCIPLSKASRGDQIQNAKYMEEKGAIIKLDQQNLTLSSLIYCLNTLKKNSTAYTLNMQKLKVDGTQEIVETIRKTMQVLAK